GEHRVVLGGLDALGDDAEPEAAAEVDRVADELVVAHAGAHAGDEAAVDLHLAHREDLEVLERRVAGPEVVDRQADAEVGEALDDRQRAGRVVDDHALGDLEDQRAGRQVPAAAQLLDVAGELRVDEDAGGEVHGHRQVAAAAGAPEAALADGGRDHLQRDRDDQPG